MPPSRPRSASLPARDTNDDWASPGSWSGRNAGGEEQDRRGAKAKLSPFGVPSFTAHKSRTLDALDLATPRASPKHGAMPSVQAVKSAMKAAGSMKMFDAHALASAVGGDKKLAAKIEQKMQANRDMHRAFTNQVMGAVEKKGWGALHSVSQEATKNFIGQQLSAFQAKTKKK